MIFKIVIAAIVIMMTFGAYMAFRGVMQYDIKKSEEQMHMGLWIILSGSFCLFLIAVLWLFSPIS